MYLFFNEVLPTKGEPKSIVLKVMSVYYMLNFSLYLLLLFTQQNMAQVVASPTNGR